MDWRAYARSLMTLPGVHLAVPQRPWHVIAAPVVASALYLALMWGVLYRQPVAGAVARHIDLRLVAAALALGFLAVTARLAGIPPREAGLGDRTAVRAVALLAVVWCIGQLVLVIACAVTGTPLAIAAAWRTSPADVVVVLVFQLVAVAAIEETVFRGWLLRQLCRRWPLAYAIAGAAVVFTAFHLPVFLLGSTSHPGLASYLRHIALLAVLYSLLYLRTGDLAFAIAMHVLANEPAPLVESPVVSGAVYDALFLLRIAIEPWRELQALRRKSST